MHYSIEKRILDICRYEYQFFFQQTNVVGMGLGYKKIKGIKTYRLAIVVFVSKKLPEIF